MNWTQSAVSFAVRWVTVGLVAPALKKSGNQPKLRTFQSWVGSILESTPETPFFRL